VRFELAPTVPSDVDAVAELVRSDQLSEAPFPDFLAAQGFAGKLDQTLALPPSGGEPARVLVGLGAPESFDASAFRRAGAALGRAVRRYGHVASTLPDAAGVRPFVEGFGLALYSFTPYRSAEKGDAIERLTIVGGDATAQGDLDRGVELVRAVSLARDLVNEPGGVLTPDEFVRRAVEVAESSGLTCEAWEGDRLASERLGGLLGVSRGSVQPPRLLRLTFRPEAPERTIVLVGKGVTFDSGGLTIKPGRMMIGMKSDMAGAAVVLATMSALRDAGVRAEVHAVIPLTDNMVSGDATRPGDVLTMRNGKTVEVLNTDAEGRLILADALVLAGELEPDAIIDLATLTDAAPTALGRGMAAVLGTDRALVDALLAAAERAGEPMWELPFRRELRGTLDSTIADLVNHKPGEQHAGSILGALFLAEFVPNGVPWTHVDIGGCAIRDGASAEWTPGGTGYGVRALIELLANGWEQAPLPLPLSRSRGR
jgi:leucyl aminopeptidase